MRRIQLHLDEDVDEALAAEAARLGMSKAALIRTYLAEHVGGARSRRDPSLELVAAYEGEPDESDRVDEVVYRP